MKTEVRNKITDLLDELSDLFVMDPYTNPLELIHKAARGYPDLNITRKPFSKKSDSMSDMTYGDLIKAIKLYKKSHYGRQ